jgi:hypothetical protein
LTADRLAPRGFVAFLTVAGDAAAPAEALLVLGVDVVTAVVAVLAVLVVLGVLVVLAVFAVLVVLAALVVLVVPVELALLVSGPPQPLSTATITRVGVRKSERPRLTKLVICICTCSAFRVSMPSGNRGVLPDRQRYTNRYQVFHNHAAEG